MLFCLGEGFASPEGEGYHKKNRIFNVDVSESQFNDALKTVGIIKISHTRWIEEKDMSRDDKKKYSDYKTLGGCLKQISYEEAWQNWWDEATSSQKNAILDLKQFDAEIFKEITGIEVGKENSKKRELLKKAQELIDKAKELQEQAKEM